MERLNRGLQRALLTSLGDRYPADVQPEDLGYTSERPDWNVNMLYLSEHGLVEVTTHRFQDSMAGPQVHLARVTAKGLDFLQDDGGLGAILNVVTVRFEAETLRGLIDAKVDASEATPEQKSTIKKKLADLGTDALKELTKKLVNEGLAHWPTAWHMLHQAVS